MCKTDFTPNLTHGRATIYREDVEQNQIGLYGTWCESCSKVVADMLLEIGALGIDK